MQNGQIFIVRTSYFESLNLRDHQFDSSSRLSDIYATSMNFNEQLTISIDRAMIVAIRRHYGQLEKPKKMPEPPEIIQDVY